MGGLEEQRKVEAEKLPVTDFFFFLFDYNYLIC